MPNTPSAHTFSVPSARAPVPRKLRLVLSTGVYTPRTTRASYPAVLPGPAYSELLRQPLHSAVQTDELRRPCRILSLIKVGWFSIQKQHSTPLTTVIPWINRKFLLRSTETSQKNYCRVSFHAVSRMNFLPSLMLIHV